MKGSCFGNDMSGLSYNTSPRNPNDVLYPLNNASPQVDNNGTIIVTNTNGFQHGDNLLFNDTGGDLCRTNELHHFTKGSLQGTDISSHDNMITDSHDCENGYLYMNKNACEPMICATSDINVDNASSLHAFDNATFHFNNKRSASSFNNGNTLHTITNEPLQDVSNGSVAIQEECKPKFHTANILPLLRGTDSASIYSKGSSSLVPMEIDGVAAIDHAIRSRDTESSAINEDDIQSSSIDKNGLSNVVGTTGEIFSSDGNIVISTNISESINNYSKLLKMELTPQTTPLRHLKRQTPPSSTTNSLTRRPK